LRVRAPGIGDIIQTICIRKVKKVGNDIRNVELYKVGRAALNIPR
jgi:hypothetical protein